MGTSRFDDALLEQLLEHADGRLNTIDAMETALEKLKAEVAQHSVDKLLKDFGPEDDSPKPCPCCRRPTPVQSTGVERTFEALSGTHTLSRNYHYCRKCKHGFYPLDAQLGLPKEGSVSVKLEGRLLDFAVNDPYGHCAERWEVHYPDRPFSDNMFRVTTDRVGKRLEIALQPLVQKELARPTTGKRELLYVLNDGSMLPGLGGWKEAKVGVVFDADDYTPGRPTRRGHIGAARYVAVWGDQTEFREMMRHALDVQRWQRYEKIVWLGDGARGNWSLADRLCPTAVQILDPGHAVENGVDCGKVLLGEECSLVVDWQRRIEQLLMAGDVDRLVGELMECLPETTTDKQVEALDSIVRYYRNNQERMDYPFYRSQGWIIGSGIVESAHRHVLQARMKLSGQHWSEVHGRRMVGLRAAYRTAGPKRFHDAINRAVVATYTQRRREATQHAMQ